VIRDPKHFARTSVPCLWPKANCEAIICASEREFTLHQKAILVAKTYPACRHVTLGLHFPLRSKPNSIVPELTQRKLPHDAPLSCTGCAKQ
jgi:hypothetical protein